MASRGVVGIFLLSALPLLCLELRRGIPSLEGEEENEKRQRLVRKRQQEAQGEKASSYIQNVLKPQQERKLKMLEERLYQMTGETRKLTAGHKLEAPFPGSNPFYEMELLSEMHSEMGLTNLVEMFIEVTRETAAAGNEDLVLENLSQVSFETTNREAARRRNLPKLSTEMSPPARQTLKEVLDLPDEPPEAAEEVVTVALRCPSGHVVRRRFFKSWNSQVLFDWMMKIGYHKSLYSLSTSFPEGL